MIHNSASKIVLLLLTGALIALTAMRIVEAKDFIVLISMAYTYYFTRKRDEPNNTA